MASSKSEQVARLLLDRIISAGLSPGSSFGTETELLAQFKVSRPTLRESLRILESQGVLTLRPGPRGGIIVGKPSVDFVIHTLSVFMRLNDVPFGAVLKARMAIEPALVREAAQNGTEEQFAEMAASIERMGRIGDDPAAFAGENRVFHGVIAQAADNTVLETFWATIAALASGEGHGLRYGEKNRAHIVKAHGRILAACRARNADAAAAEMVQHLGELETLLRTRYSERLSAPTRIALRPGRRIS